MSESYIGAPIRGMLCSLLHWSALEVQCIVNGMKRWGWLVGLGLVGGVWGCSASDESSLSSGSGGGGGLPILPGGQTGSLVPVCGAIPGLATRSSVPSGDSAFVVYDPEGCDPMTSPEGLVIQRDDGAEMPYSLVDLGEGRVLVRADELLAPGSYFVEMPDTERRDLVVAEPAPLPERLGTLKQMDVYQCAATFDLVLDPAAVPYASLMRLSLSIDGADPIVWQDYGRIEQIGGRAVLPYKGAPGDLQTGDHSFVVVADIAGETLALDAVTVHAFISCDSPRDSSQPSSGGGCDVARAGGSGGQTGLLITMLASIAACMWRRRLRDGAARRSP